MLDKALRVLNFSAMPCTLHTATGCGEENLARTPYFTTNLLTFSAPLERDYAPIDSFVAYMCVVGSCEVVAPESDPEEQHHTLSVGEAILIPACLNDISLRPSSPECRLLEIYV
jgi:mannose-6-phosphate isomerase